MIHKTIREMSGDEIWEGWCGNASPSSDDGKFDTINEAIDYVRDRVRDWGGEILEMPNAPGEPIRYIADITEDEIKYIAETILNYSLDNRTPKGGLRL